MSESYGERVAHVREELGLKQEEFAAQVGIPKRTLQDIENGKVAKPQKRTRDKIDAVLQLAQHGDGVVVEGDAAAFMDLLEVYLAALPESARVAFIHDTIRRMANPKG